MDVGTTIKWGIVFAVSFDGHTSARDGKGDTVTVNAVVAAGEGVPVPVHVLSVPVLSVPVLVPLPAAPSATFGQGFASAPSKQMAPATRVSML